MSRLLLILLLSPLMVNAADLKQIQQNIQKKIPQGKIEQVRETPIAGLYEVSIDGFIIYMSADGRYQVQGDIIDRQESRNITKLSILDTISDSTTIVFKPKSKKADYTLTVFTDIDCGYCRKLHDEVPKLNENNIKVRYLMFPRAGLESGSAKKLESVWCSDNPQQAMTLAKSGASIPPKQCKNPMKEHMNLVRALGIRGTPFIMTANGTTIPGYKPANDLMNILRSEPQAAN